MNIFKIRMGKCWCHGTPQAIDIWRHGYLDASMNYSDIEGRAKIAMLRFEKK
jgi:hypothetical protein